MATIKPLSPGQIRGLPKALHYWLMDLEFQTNTLFPIADVPFLVLTASSDLTNERVFTPGTGLDAVDGGAGSTYTLSVDETELPGNDAQYLVLTANATLSSERVFTLGNGLDAVDSGAGAAYTVTVDETELNHNLLSNLAVGDVHTQYLLRTQWLQNGFTDDSDVTLTWDDGTKTLTVAPAVTSFSYFCDGVLYTKSVAQTKAITDTEGLWVFYFDGATLTAANAPSHGDIDAIIEDSCIVAWLYWDAANNDGRLFSELHGYRMSPATHHYLHDNIGAVYKSGMAIETIATDEDGSLAAHAQFGVALGSFYDEDLEIDLDAIASTVGLEVWYLDGANWRWDTNAGYPVLTTGTGRLAWNSTGTVVEVDNTKFVLCHVFATNIRLDDGTSPYYIAVMGQAQYDTVAAARVGAETEMGSLATGALPMPEIVPVATVIYQTQDSYTNAVNARTRSTASGDDWIDWRTSNIVSSGAISDHGGLAGLTDDDHSQYLLLAGRSGGQTAYGGTASGDDLTLHSTSNATKGHVAFGTKIFVKDGTGKIGIGANASDPAEMIHLIESEDNVNLRSDTYWDSGASVLGFRRARGTYALPTQITSGSDIFNILGSAWHSGADWGLSKVGILAEAAEDWTLTANGTSLTIETTKNTTTTRRIASKWSNAANTLIGLSTDPTTLEHGLAMETTAAPTAVGANVVALYTADANAVGGKSWWHGMGEDDVAHQIAGIIYPAGTGDPTTMHDGSLCVNVTDATVKIHPTVALGWKRFLFHNWGVSGGSTLIGGTAAGDDLTLNSTSNATKGTIFLGSSAGFDEVNTRLGIGTTTPSDGLHLFKSGAGIGARIDTYNGTGSTAASIDLRRSKGTSGSETAVAAGNYLAELKASGWYDTGVDWSDPQASLIAAAAENWTATNRGTYWMLQTTENATTTKRDVLKITNTGNVLLGMTTDPTDMKFAIGCKTTAAPAACGADVVALYTADARGQAGQSFWHAMGEKDSAYLLSGIRFTDASGAPSATGAHEGAWEYNVADNALYTYLETAWHGVVLADSTNYVDLTDAGATTLHKHDHGGMDGLTDDDHVGYARLAGRSGGQSWTAGTDAGDDLTLSSTAHATKGNIHLGAASTFDEVNNRLGIGTLAPVARIEAVDDGGTNCFRAYAYYDGITGAGIRTLRARGSVAAPRRIQSGDVVGVYNSIGAYAADDVSDAAFGAAGGQSRFIAGEAYTSTAMGTDFVLSLAPIGSATITEALRVKANGHLVLPELTSNPSTADLTADGAIAIYTKADTLVFAYNDGGTMTYITLGLDGSDITWAHGTSAP